MKERREDKGAKRGKINEEERNLVPCPPVNL